MAINEQNETDALARKEWRGCEMKHVRGMTKRAPLCAEAWQTWICTVNQELVEKGGGIPLVTTKCDYPESNGDSATT